MSDQVAKADRGKPRLTLAPMQILYCVAAVREYGVSKYPHGGVDNWKRVEVSRYRDALLRHTVAYISDPTGVDEESGLPHLWHLACNVAFLCELEKKHEKTHDIRPVSNAGDEPTKQSQDDKTEAG